MSAGLFILEKVMNANLVTGFGIRRPFSDRHVDGALAGLVAAVAARTGSGGLPGLALPLFLCVGMTGFIVANSIPGASLRWIRTSQGQPYLALPMD